MLKEKNKKNAKASKFEGGKNTLSNHVTVKIFGSPFTIH